MIVLSRKGLRKKEEEEENTTFYPYFENPCLNKNILIHTSAFKEPTRASRASMESMITQSFDKCVATPECAWMISYQ
jgi:hypothetical protein